MALNVLNGTNNIIIYSTGSCSIDTMTNYKHIIGHNRNTPRARMAGAKSVEIGFVTNFIKKDYRSE